MGDSFSLFIRPNGRIDAIVTDAVERLPLYERGAGMPRRASHVEPVAGAGWTADMAPVGGPVLGPFKHRSEALAAEHEWLLDRLREGRLFGSE
jgi:hypothetical protein